MHRLLNDFGAVKGFLRTFSVSGLDKIFPVATWRRYVEFHPATWVLFSTYTKLCGIVFFCPSLAFSVVLFFLRDDAIGMTLLSRLQINLLCSNILKGFGLAESRLTCRSDSGPGQVQVARNVSEQTFNPEGLTMLGF